MYGQTPRREVAPAPRLVVRYSGTLTKVASMMVTILTVP
ncbi:hypothetical protein PA08_2387 [Cutibacterium modestum P08]|nr:hypothetical protein PA08_2387 [Cutibacterium modestum P08]